MIIDYPVVWRQLRVTFSSLSLTVMETELTGPNLSSFPKGPKVKVVLERLSCGVGCV